MFRVRLTTWQTLNRKWFRPRRFPATSGTTSGVGSLLLAQQTDIKTCFFCEFSSRDMNITIRVRVVVGHACWFRNRAERRVGRCWPWVGWPWRHTLTPDRRRHRTWRRNRLGSLSVISVATRRAIASLSLVSLEFTNFYLFCLFIYWIQALSSLSPHFWLLITWKIHFICVKLHNDS